ncbi:MAG: DUF4124 domain-containing protein [Burkholderiales bacterium]
MTKALVLLVALALAGAAQAQQYKWVDKDGKVRYGDTPPPGVKATALKPPPGPAAVTSPRAKVAAAKAGRYGPFPSLKDEYKKGQQETPSSGRAPAR